MYFLLSDHTCKESRLPLGVKNSPTVLVASDDAFELARQELDIAERAAMEELERLKATDEEKTALAQGFANKRKDIAT